MAPIESTIRGHRKPRVPRNGLKFGDPLPAGFTVGQVTPGHGGGADATFVSPHKRVQRGASQHLHHAAATTAAAPPTRISDDSYISNFFTYALGRAPYTSGNPSEQTYWYNMLRAAENHGQTSMVLAMREMGMTLFESSHYAARNRSNHDYVYDLYETYLVT